MSDADVVHALDHTARDLRSLVKVPRGSRPTTRYYSRRFRAVRQLHEIEATRQEVIEMFERGETGWQTY